MKKVDILTPVGIIGAVGLIFYGISVGKGGLKLFVDMPSLAITVGCSFFSVLIVYSFSEMKLLVKATIDAFFEVSLDRLYILTLFENLLIKVKSASSMNVIEEELDKIDDEFLKKGLELVLDNASEEDIKMILKAKTKEEQQAMLKGSKMYMTWGSLAPAFGMVGTLIGLIQMMADLGNPDDIASGMAVALITTFYGAVGANLFFNPLGFNLKNKADMKLSYREMQITALMSLKNEDSRFTLRDKLSSYLTSDELILSLSENKNKETEATNSGE